MRVLVAHVGSPLSVHLHKQMKTSCKHRLISLGRYTDFSHESVYLNDFGKQDTNVQSARKSEAAPPSGRKHIFMHLQLSKRISWQQISEILGIGFEVISSLPR